jgi:hypothetical protein
VTFCLSRFKCIDAAVKKQHLSPQVLYPEDVLSDPENRVAFVFSQNLMKLICKYRSGVMSVFEADEDTLPFYMGYKMHIALKDVITPKISQFIESGIIRHTLRGASLESFKTKPKKVGPQILTLAHLKAGFIVISVLLGVSVLIFMVECGPMLAKKLFEWCLSLFLPCYTVVKFTRMNRML